MIPEHPYTKNYLRIVTVSAIAIIAIFVQWGLLLFYRQTDIIAVFIDSIISTGTLFILSYLLWYAIGFTNAFQAEVALTVIVMFVWIVGCYIGQYLGEQIGNASLHDFIATLPIRLSYGLLCWIIIFQWYHIQRLKNWKEEHTTEENMQAMQTMDETIDRIVVKDGKRIHIIQLENLIYIQASGDYVTFFTPTGQYLKEQTMKHMEAYLLPSRFVRIHRSYIVNVEQINRVELLGKEIYHVLLKNGATLRASSFGYKLLKEQLSI